MDNILGFYVCILTVVTSPTVIGREALGPMAFVKGFYGVPDVDQEPYIELQKQLEDIAEKAHLYDLSEQEREIEEKSLFQRPDVQNIVSKCQQFHTKIQCEDSLYRSYDGTCNNLKYPKWGSCNYILNRLMPAYYRGVRGLRKSVTGDDLPEPRSISLKLINKDNPSDIVSAFFTFFGQFVAHDMTSASSSSSNGVQLPCCDMKGNPACETNILFPEDDPFFHQFKVRCWPLPRAVPYPKCNFEKRNPMNKQTAFLDASATYGNNENLAKSLRAYDGKGKLNVHESKFGKILPRNAVQDILFCPHNETNYCFASGDVRLNQHTMLSTMHTLYNRFHNVLSERLHQLNPHWKEEKLYQETRRVVIAIHQNIIFQEYLPLLLTPEHVKEYQLSVEEPSLYNDEINPNIVVEFATAAFRLHSMVPKKIAKNYTRPFDMIYSFPKPLHEGKLEPLIAGTCEVPSEKNDNFMMEHETNYLFRPPGADYGSDVASINIQRGRDHGLPLYVDMVRYCSKGRLNVKKFSDLNKIVPRRKIKLLKDIYKDVSDIDLWIGLLMERPLHHLIYGFTGACISAEQFHLLKYGDSFFFTHSNGRYPFTTEQLNSIRNYTLAQMVCHSGDFFTIRRSPFKLPGGDNDLVACQSQSQLDLSPWKE